MGSKPERPRDVTTTELAATTAAERNALTHLAADARMLTNDRHPNLVPIVEARWLAANRLAITRARVRGSTLRQALDAVGPMPEPRVVEVLNDVGGVLDWASRSGVVHRHVSSDCVCFQQGNGRVMVSFGLPASLDGERARSEDDTAFLFERCADGATLARLAYEMLTAHRVADASIESLGAVRPETSPEMVDAITAGLSCSTGGPALTARQFLAMLPGGKAPVVGTAAIATAASAPVVPRGASVPLAPAAIPLVVPAAPRAPASAAPAAVPVAAAGAAAPAPRRRRGRGLLIASTLALVLLVGSTFALIQRDRSGAGEQRAAVTAQDTEAAGDVDVPETDTLPPDPDGLTTGENMPRQPAPALPSELPSELPSNLPQPLPEALPPIAEPRSQPIPPVIEPRRPVPPAPIQPQPAPIERPSPRPSSVATGGGCESPTMADQRACLSGIIESSDRELTSVYQALLRAVGERDGEAAVEDVRVGQRAWLASRDRACRSPAAREGALWASDRGACLARQSDARALELARALAAVRNSRP